MLSQYYTNIYSHKQFYNAFLSLFLSSKSFKLNKKSKHVSPQFRERIMLAVTQTNGCEACAFIHTKVAQKVGIDASQIKAILHNNLETIPDDEMPAIMFACHYAENKGTYSIDAWNNLVKEYGTEKAQVIQVMIRLIIVGNIYGMSLSAFKDRIKGKPTRKTSLFYELSIFMMFIPYLTTSRIHSLFLNK